MKVQVNRAAAPGFSTLDRKVRGNRSRGGMNKIKGCDVDSLILLVSLGGR